MGDKLGAAPGRERQADGIATDGAAEAVVFTGPEEAALLALRDRVARGLVNEWTAEYRRLRFQRWRYEHGLLTG